MKKILLLASISLLALPTYSQVWNTTNPLTTGWTVGVGTTTPAAQLEVQQFNQSGTLRPALLVVHKNGLGVQNGPPLYKNTMEVKHMVAGPFGNYTTYLDFWVESGGLVGVSNALRIGSTAANGAYANYKLSVDGDMIAKRCVIQVTDWADYVFADDYHLPTLNEVEAFVKENNHLPGVPSEAEVKEKGMDVGDMNKILMQKVEELTLYIIDLKKEINEIKAQQ